MFLVMGITGKVGGAMAEHLLARGKEVRALVRNREKASSWAKEGVELVDGDWNDSAAIGGRSKASKARLSCCRPSGLPRPITKKPRS
jgi:nucleoside-diphosphate-sugar epimerase